MIGGNKKQINAVVIKYFFNILLLSKNSKSIAIIIVNVPNILR